MLGSSSLRRIKRLDPVEQVIKLEYHLTLVGFATQAVQKLPNPLQISQKCRGLDIRIDDDRMLQDFNAVTTQPYSFARGSAVAPPPIGASRRSASSTQRR